MTKSDSKKSKTGKDVKAVHSANFDDQSIRELLRNSYPDFQEGILESQIVGSVEILMELPSQSMFESQCTDLSHPENSPDLTLVWKLFVQRNIIDFEQESLLFLELEKRSSLVR